MPPAKKLAKKRKRKAPDHRLRDETAVSAIAASDAMRRAEARIARGLERIPNETARAAVGSLLGALMPIAPPVIDEETGEEISAAEQNALGVRLVTGSAVTLARALTKK